MTILQDRADGPAAANGFYWAALMAVAIALLLPILAVQHPPLVDYPNHLARAWILRQYGDTPGFRQNYELHLAPIPNLALDLLVPLLLRWFGVLAAGRIFLALTVILFIAGCHLLGKAVHGRPTWLALPCAFFVYSVEFLWGFMNFVLGMALFLICIALWLRWREHWTTVRLLLLALLVTSTYFAHLMDYAFVALAIGLMTFSRWAGRMRKKPAILSFRRAAGKEESHSAVGFRARFLASLGMTPIGTVLRDPTRGETRLARAVLDLVPLVPPIFLFGVYMRGGGRVGSVEWDTLGRKAAATASTVLTYRWQVDAALIAGFAIIALLVFMRSERVRVFQPLFAAALVFILLYVAMPYRLFTGTDADNRFVPAALLLLVLSLRIEIPRRAARVLLTAWLALSVFRLAVIWNTWRQLDRRASAMIGAFTAFPLGSRIYPALCMACETKSERGLHHAILYATIYRQAFVPSLLALESQEVIRFRHPAVVREAGTSGWIDGLSGYDFVWSHVIPPSAGQDLERCCRLVLRGDGFGIWEVPKVLSDVHSSIR